MNQAIRTERTTGAWMVVPVALFAMGVLPSQGICQTFGKTEMIRLKVTAVSPSAVNLTWNDITGETGYQIYVNDSPWGSRLSANTTFCPVTGRRASTYYTFQVRSIPVVAWQRSVSSNVVAGTTPSATRPVLTVTRQPDLSDTSFELKVTYDWGTFWSSQQRYELQFTEPGQTVFPSGQNTLDYALSDPRSPQTLRVSPQYRLLGQTVRYRVRAWISNTSCSSWSNSISVTFPGLRVRVLPCSQFVLEWPNAGRETEWRVYQWTRVTGWVERARIYGDGNSPIGPIRARVIDLAAGFDQAWLRVEARDPWSPLWSATLCTDSTSPDCPPSTSFPELVANAAGTWLKEEPRYIEVHKVVISNYRTGSYVQRFVNNVRQTSGTGWMTNQRRSGDGSLYSFDVNGMTYILSTTEPTINFWLPDGSHPPYTFGLALQKQ